MEIVKGIVSYLQDLLFGFTCLIIFFFPAIIALIGALLGYSILLDNETFFGFVLYWAVTEFLAFYLIAMRIKNIEKIGIRLFAGTLFSAFFSAIGIVTFSGLPGLYDDDYYKEIKKADYNKFHYARIALFSGMFALLLTLIAVLIMLTWFLALGMS
jgi:hypothetical protein